MTGGPADLAASQCRIQVTLQPRQDSPRGGTSHELLMGFTPFVLGLGTTIRNDYLKLTLIVTSCTRKLFSDPKF